jgi:hypothetical protein
VDGARPRVVNRWPGTSRRRGCLGTRLLLLPTAGALLLPPTAAVAAATLAATTVVLGAVPVAAPPPSGVGAGGLRGLLRELGGGGESGDWRRLLVRQSELLQGEVLADVEEGGEGPSATEQGADVGEALVEAADYVEDEGAVGDDFPESAEVVDHLLEAAAVLGNGEVALDEVAEPRLKLDGAYLPVPKELGLDGEPGVPGRAALGGGDLGEVVGERTKDPELDDAIHPIPIRGGGLLQQHGAMEIHWHGRGGCAIIVRGSESGGGSLGGRLLLICARQGGVAGAGSDASLLLCLGQAGKGHVVGLLALQGGGAGYFRGQAGGDLILLDAGEGGRCRLVDEAGDSRLVLGSGTLGRQWRSASHGAAWQGGRCAGAARRGVDALVERKREKNLRWNLVLCYHERQ